MDIQNSNVDTGLREMWVGGRMVSDMSDLIYIRYTEKRNVGKGVG